MWEERVRSEKKIDRNERISDMSLGEELHQSDHPRFPGWSPTQDLLVGLSGDH